MLTTERKKEETLEGEGERDTAKVGKRKRKKEKYLTWSTKKLKAYLIILNKINKYQHTSRSCDFHTDGHN